MSIGIRHIPMAVGVIGAAGDYVKELIKYPPQFKIGFFDAVLTPGGEPARR